MSDRYYEEARAVAIACLIRHGQFSPEDAPVAYADGCIEACAECIAAALRARPDSGDLIADVIDETKPAGKVVRIGWRDQQGRRCWTFFDPEAHRDLPPAPDAALVEALRPFLKEWRGINERRDLPGDYTVYSGSIIRLTYAHVWALFDALAAPAPEGDAR